MSISGAEVAGASTVLVDPGPLLLLLVGSVDPKLIPRHKRLDAYSENDFANLYQALLGRGRTAVNVFHLLRDLAGYS